MGLWLVRTGRNGQHEQKFLETNRIYVTWAGLRHDLSTLADREELKGVLRTVYPDKSEKALGGAAGQIGIIWQDMRVGELVIVPSKLQPAIHIAKIMAEYSYDGRANDPYYHYRDVEWIAQGVARSKFASDLLASFSGMKTIFRVKAHDAENRVRKMLSTTSEPSTTRAAATDSDGEADPPIDLEQVARDEIANTIIARFKSHGMERLVEAILIAKGYTTYTSPAGPDKGIDILAAPGPMGFGDPRLCVQVKSWDSPVDIKILNELVGAMQNVGAQQALLVS
jgi:restriction system protein